MVPDFLHGRENVVSGVECFFMRVAAKLSTLFLKLLKRLSQVFLEGGNSLKYSVVCLDAAGGGAGARLGKLVDVANGSRVNLCAPDLQHELGFCADGVDITFVGKFFARLKLALGEDTLTLEDFDSCFGRDFREGLGS